MLFFLLDIAFLMLAIGHFQHSSGTPNAALIKAGGLFGLLAAFLAWYNAVAGIADENNSFVQLPLGPLPWANGKRKKTDREVV